MKDAPLNPKLKAIMRRGTWAKAGGIQSFPLATCSKHKENRFHTNTVWSTGPPSPEAMRVAVFGKALLDDLPQIVGNTPVFR
jgi:hypothetical protein